MRLLPTVIIVIFNISIILFASYQQKNLFICLYDAHLLLLDIDLLTKTACSPFTS